MLNSTLRHSFLQAKLSRRTTSAINPHQLNLSAQTRKQSAWGAAVDSAKNLLNDSNPPPPASVGSTDSKEDRGKSKSKASFNFKSLLPKPSSLLPSKPKSTPIIRDPLSLVSSELSSLRSNVTSLLGSGHPALDTIAKYYFQAEGKHVRPLIVLLMAKATNGLSPTWSSRNLGESGDRDFSGNNESGKQTEKDCGIDEPLSPREVLNDFNPHMESVEGVQGQERSSFTSASTITSSPETIATTYEIGSYPILPTQRRLAEITEMIHVASLLHDDVIDASSVRRSAPSAPAAFGNKLSILGGDFLLGRASVALARLRDNEVVELLATVIANLVEGEVMQLKSQSNLNSKQNKSIFSNFWNVGNKEILGRSNVEESRNENGNSRLSIKLSNSPFAPTPELFENYLQKTYLKTAALIGKSARASVILGGNGSDSSSLSSIGTEDLSRKIRDSAYAYGRNLGIAFQLVDDLLDFKSTSLAFGKPSGGADLRLGLATAPVLYAWEEMEEKGMKEMKEMVERKFETKGDVEKVLRIVNASSGLERTADLARHHAKLATDALEIFPESEARDALIQLTEQVLTRAK